MRTSPRGIGHIKKFEGCVLKAYKDAVGVLTIGYGSTGSHVTEGLAIDTNKAEELLVRDLARFEKAVNTLVTVPITQGQFDALVSFAFNLGIGSLKTSTLLKKLNKKEYKEASEEFLRWNKAGGKVLRGLTARRIAERAMFIEEAIT